MMTNPTWRKSSYSGEGNCVELSGQAGRVLVRDTQDRRGPVLKVSAKAWREFVGRVQER
ncbi:MAG TPA: DUF397 domain-containing protein [Streptosporangiaceae bacterium]|jgi:hypothetical protein